MVLGKSACKGKATKHYEKFHDLWEDTDPGIVEVDDAKKRLDWVEGIADDPKFSFDTPHLNK